MCPGFTPRALKRPRSRPIDRSSADAERLDDGPEGQTADGRDINTATKVVRHLLFKSIANASVSHQGLLVVPCNTCQAPRASVFDCHIGLDLLTDKFKAFCLNCFPSEHDRAHMKMEPVPTYGLTRKATWVRQFGLNSVGKCPACNKLIDFTDFHCAHDIARALGGDYVVENLFACCAGCNLGNGVSRFSDVILATRLKLNNFEALKERFEAHMVLGGLRWMSSVALQMTEKCPFTTEVFSNPMRTYVTVHVL